MMQDFVLLLLLNFLGVSWASMLRPGIEPVISFTGARDYARSAVASLTSVDDIAAASIIVLYACCKAEI